MSTNLHPTFDQMLPREAKESLLGQRGLVVWLYGMSGSGKSTLAHGLEKQLHEQKIFTKVLDGDNVRTGLNHNLGFTDEDRNENIRRVSEVAKLFAEGGIVTIASFITPTNTLRSLAREIIGDSDLLEVYVKASFDVCAERDVKGLYAKAKAGEVKHFTGKDSAFEEPDRPDLVLDTETESVTESLDALHRAALERIHPPSS